MNPYNTSVTAIKGIGDAKAKLLLRLGVSTVWDLLTHFPARFEDRTLFRTVFSADGTVPCCIRARVIKAPTENRVRKNLVYYKVTAADETGIITCTFFNNRYIPSLLKTGETYVFYGTVKCFGNKKEMTSPEFEKIGDDMLCGKIVPVYPLTGGLTQSFMRRAIKEALRLSLDCLIETLPTEIMRRHTLCRIGYAVQNIHFPSDAHACEVAKRRLVFEEFFILQTALSYSKKRNAASRGIRFETVDTAPFEATLGFTLTAAQKKVLCEICADLSSGQSMNRLIQGDVGSGKTAVAAAALYLCAVNGHQAAMMAPTEVLAQQHFSELSPLFEKLGVKCVLLCGSTPAAKKREYRARIKDGAAQIAFGTHALITKDVAFKDLALAITDEQHRFGVRQRTALSEKGARAHTLVMTATPIPRSLALVMYGDTDISVIDSLPPGRQKIDTFCVGENMRERIYAFIKKQISLGRRVYYICPSVEEADCIELKNVNTVYAEFTERIFPDVKIGLIHGKLSSAKKEAAMRDFALGNTQMLVATTVIEVGINVPSATLIVIENAERFGLSQLHQLRGRVGRGREKSFCILFCSSNSDSARDRMRAVVESSDGFALSQTDLRLRGPGDFFGTEQHGALKLKIADLAQDASVLKESSAACAHLLSDDPQLLKKENFYIRERMNALLKRLSL